MKVCPSAYGTRMFPRKAWEALGDISANGAMAGFCNLLETVCPDLVPWIRHKKRVRDSMYLMSLRLIFFQIFNNHDFMREYAISDIMQP